MTMTMSYRPCVQNMSLTVTPNVSAICLKAYARFGESLAFLTPCSVNLASTTYVAMVVFLTVELACIVARRGRRASFHTLVWRVNGALAKDAVGADALGGERG